MPDETSCADINQAVFDAYRTAATIEPANVSGASATRTPWAVECKLDGLVYLTIEEYMRQLGNAGKPWTCPSCGSAAYPVEG